MSTFAKILGTIAVLAAAVGCSELDTVTAESGVVRVEAPCDPSRLRSQTIRSWSGNVRKSSNVTTGSVRFLTCDS